jgi:hypothetical protein
MKLFDSWCDRTIQNNDLGSPYGGPFSFLGFSYLFGVYTAGLPPVGAQISLGVSVPVRRLAPFIFSPKEKPVEDRCHIACGHTVTISRVVSFIAEVVR